MEKQKTYVVEHLDPELEAWSSLEYKTIGEECKASGATFCLSSLHLTLELTAELRAWDGLLLERRAASEIYKDQLTRVCLLDPAAKEELSPKDASKFDVFLFGGILGDDPPRDRTSELRNQGFHGRRLGPVQMTTDTAVRVTRTVIQDQVPLDKIPYIDFPELKLDEHESTEMPFRYVKNDDGSPVMPTGMIELIKQDADKGLDGLLD